ncbi:putative FAD synthetase [Mitosporidium daphniae]|uniref:FAD synthase n=1 Tax=Mitosporidium daphniae TaxID=1485682 RepID=A0A098VNF2_9MICR|nr:putative FAD synthetase [Mitosporidium daphniae]KGG50583.1 putative FAD synthetase [Mitosporidium daphniae]|eukprot:XP_013237030.1 putative FAD synthetase [Mitosporidium daphniae]
MVFRERFSTAVKLSPNIGSIALSFNGGKDCTALLVHLLACIGGRSPLPLLYLHNDDQFEEEWEFSCALTSMIGADKVQLHRLECTDLKDGLSSFLQKYPNISVLFLGVRLYPDRPDELKPIQMTDPGWPQVLRVHPLLDWTYSEIWLFLRTLSIPYCTLYDQGYTSIGGKEKTKPNPALRCTREQGKYKPAYDLLDDSLERAGRS